MARNILKKLLNQVNGTTARNTYNPTFMLQAIFPTMSSKDTFGKYGNRLFRYEFLNHMYMNTMYSSLVTYATQYKNEFELYEYVRGVYNPASRLVDFYPQRVYGGDLDFQKMSSASMSLVGTDDKLDKAISKLWRHSKWNVNKNLFVRYGATYGDSYLYLAQDDNYGKVWMEILHPSMVEYIQKNPFGDIDTAILTEQEFDKDGNPRMRSTLITPESFTIYYNKSGVIGTGILDSSQMEVVEEYANPYGFVPLVHAPHKDNGLLFGLSAPQHIILKIDELNTLASLLNDQIRNLVQPVIFFSGVAAESDVDDNSIDLSSERHSVPALYAPEGARAEPIVADVDLRGALDHIQSLRAEIEQDCPELAIHTLKTNVYINDPSVRASFTDVESRLGEARANYNEAVIKAHQMGVAIGAYHKYVGYEAFSLSDYAKENLVHDIAPRELIEESISLDERLKILLELDDKEYQDAILSELKYTDDQLREFEKMKQQRRAEKVEENLIDKRLLAIANMRSANLQPDTSEVPFEFNQDKADEALQRSTVNRAANQLAG